MILDQASMSGQPPIAIPHKHLVTISDLHDKISGICSRSESLDAESIGQPRDGCLP
jgi:hypothetical protein